MPCGNSAGTSSNKIANSAINERCDTGFNRDKFAAVWVCCGNHDLKSDGDHTSNSIRKEIKLRGVLNHRGALKRFTALFAI